MINDRWGELDQILTSKCVDSSVGINLVHYEAVLSRRSMSHEDHAFETWTDWDKEDRTEADRRINREMIEWKKGVLDRNYGEDEGHGSK